MAKTKPWRRIIGSTQAGTLIVEMTPDYLAMLAGNNVKTIENLGEQVYAWCHANRVSLTEFARRAGLSRNRLSLLVNGHRPNITSRNAEKILRVLNA